MNLTRSTEKLYVFNRHCEISPDSSYVFESGSAFLRQCAINSIWGELDSNFAAQTRKQPIEVSDICTTTKRRNVSELCMQSPNFRDVVFFHRLHSVTCSCRQRLSRPSSLVDLFMLAWTNLHPVLLDLVPSLSSLPFEQLRKTELFV